MIHHGDTEARRELLDEEITERVIGAAIEVHRGLGPGLRAGLLPNCNVSTLVGGALISSVLLCLRGEK